LDSNTGQGALSSNILVGFCINFKVSCLTSVARETARQGTRKQGLGTPRAGATKGKARPHKGHCFGRAMGLSALRCVTVCYDVSP